MLHPGHVLVSFQATLVDLVSLARPTSTEELLMVKKPGFTRPFDVYCTGS